MYCDSAIACNNFMVQKVLLNDDTEDNMQNGSDF